MTKLVHSRNIPNKEVSERIFSVGSPTNYFVPKTSPRSAGTYAHDEPIARCVLFGVDHERVHQRTAPRVLKAAATVFGFNIAANSNRAQIPI